MDEKQKWLVLDGDDGWLIIIPNFDILPHSTTAKKDGENDLAWLDCPCKPKVNVGDKIIVHNSFKDAKRIEESLKNNQSL